MTIGVPDGPPDQTRAPARGVATPLGWAVRAISVRVPPGERRNPVAMVRLAVGPLELVLAVSRLKKSGLAVRPPMAEGGVPAITAAPDVWAVIERAAVAAVAAEPAARAHVLGDRPPRRPPVGENQDDQDA